MNIDSHTTLHLVIGNPVKHSFSPRLHQILYNLLDINAVMLAIENPALPDLINAIKTLSVKLTAITLPFKTDILTFVDSQSDAVTSLRAANTLLLRNGHVHAENTDVDGIMYALRKVNLKSKNVLIIGAGGSARAVGYALRDSQCHLFWMNKTVSHAEALCSQWGGKILHDSALNNIPIDIIINTTPVGMYPNISETPLTDFQFKPYHTVIDLIYTPKETRLLTEARSSGAYCISGLDMFIFQGIKQVSLLCDHTIDTEDLFKQCYAILDQTS